VALGWLGPAPGFSSDETAKATMTAVEEAAARGDRLALRRHMDDGDAAVQAAAFEALSAEDAGSAVEALIEIVKAGRQPTRWQALRLLDQSPQADQREVEEVLRDAQADADPLVSEYARGALAARAEGQSDERDEQALLDGLRSTDAAVQAAAFETLAAQDADAAVHDLLAAATDPGNPARLQAFRLLAESPQVGEDTKVAALRDAVADPDPELSDYARRALARRAAPSGSHERGGSSETRLLESGGDGPGVGP
jgi:HEAT repeat protein